jgi:hypothetical protein
MTAEKCKRKYENSTVVYTAFAFIGFVNKKMHAKGFYSATAVGKSTLRVLSFEPKWCYSSRIFVIVKAYLFLSIIVMFLLI